MVMPDSEIKILKDLNNLRSAPILDENQLQTLRDELNKHIDSSDWLTIGIMASSSKMATHVIREIEQSLNLDHMKIVQKPNEDGPVFLKANQNTGDIYIRIEHGLGEGIILSCQQNDESKETMTFGPFPLDFFKIKN